MTSRVAPFVALAAAALMAVSCGKKGPPQAPLRPVPVAVADVTAERLGDQVTLNFNVPATNSDGTTPPRVDGVEIYAMTQPAEAPAPTVAQLAVEAYRIAVIPVRRAGQDPTGATDKRPVAGEPTSFVEVLSAPTAPPDEKIAKRVRYYAAAGTAGNRRGPASLILVMPLTAPPEAPANVTIDYSEKELRLVWTPASASHRFVVFEVFETEAAAKIPTPPTPRAITTRVTAVPLNSAEFTAPVEFGRQRCLSVRAAEVTAGVVSAGAASPQVCVTPVDRFAPGPPADLIASANEGGVDLVWSAPAAADVAGYVVLRGEGADGTLQPLTLVPITTTQYKDQSARTGVTYSYAVVAVDSAAPRNTSEPSSRRVVTARWP